MLTQLLILCAGLGLLQSGVVAKEEKMNSDEEWISSLIEMLELDFEDICLNKAEADWAVLERMVDAIQEKLEADKHYGYFVHTQMGEVRVALTDQVRRPLLLRKVKLFTQPGDPMLESDQWNELVSFGVGSIYDLESANDYKCRADLVSNCSYSELQNTLATSRDSHLLLSAKASWEKKLPDDAYYLTHVLPLLKNASILNGFNSVEDYWDSLAEYSGALTRARDLWADVAPLYSQLAKYVAMRLTKHNATMRTDGTIPSYNLGSLLADDWSNIAPLLVPQQLIYKDILTNLNHKHIGGREAFKVAAKMLQSLGLGDLHSKIWRDSAFDKTCPARLINFCQPGNMRVFTCNKITINNYLDAHEIAMRIKHKEVAASLSTNSFILREPNRFSALHEAIAGFASLLAISPPQLDKAGVLPLKAYGMSKYKFNNKIVLQLLVALRDLPRLNYYLAADEWRLKIAASNVVPTQLGSSWPEKRRNFSFVSPSDKDFLGDPTILMNKPYIGQFLGTIMKYQILETFTADLYSEEADVVEQVSLNIARVKSVLEQANRKEWPELVHDLLGQRGLSANAIVEYFRTLKEFLDAELDPNTSNEQFYDEDFDDDLDKISLAPENDEDALQHLPENVLVEEEAELKEVPEHPTVKTEPNEENKVVEQIQLIQEGSIDKPIDDIDHLDMQDKAENSASAVGSPEKADIQESSTQMYVWIGLALVIAIVLILATIIARKRYKHKKQLEKERKRQEAGA